MPNHIPALADAPDHATVHDLDVIDAEKQLHPWGTNGIEDVHAVVDMVALVPRMPLVGIAVVAGIEHFQADGDALLFCIASDFLEALDAVLGPFLGRKLFRIAGKRNDVRATEVCRVVDRLLGDLEKHIVVLRVVVSLNERRAIHREGCNGAGQPVLLQFRPVLGSDQFHALATQLDCLLTGFMDAPVIGKAPRDDGLVDPPLADSAPGSRRGLAQDSRDGHLARATSKPSGQKAGGCALEESAARD